MVSGWESNCRPCGSRPDVSLPPCDLPCDLPCAASLAGIQPVRPRAQRTSP